MQHERIPPELPVELYEVIIDELWDDRPALLACSAVCRAFLPTSQKHLWSKAHLEFTRRRSFRTTQIMSFLTHVNLGRPPVGVYLRDLNITEDTEGPLRSGDLNGALFTTLLSNLPNLARLSYNLVPSYPHPITAISEPLLSAKFQFAMPQNLVNSHSAGGMIGSGGILPTLKCQHYRSSLKACPD